MSHDMSPVTRMATRWTALVDRMANAPRWIDAPWAVLSVAGMALSWIFESGPPYWWFATAALAFMIRSQITSRRIVLGTSALTPLANRIGDWLYERRQRKLSGRKKLPLAK